MGGESGHELLRGRKTIKELDSKRNEMLSSTMINLESVNRRLRLRSHLAQKMLVMILEELFEHQSVLADPRRKIAPVIAALTTHTDLGADIVCVDVVFPTPTAIGLRTVESLAKDGHP